MCRSNAVQKNQKHARFAFYKTATLMQKPSPVTAKPATSLRVAATKSSQPTQSTAEFSLWLVIGLLLAILIGVFIVTVVRYIAFTKEVHDSDDEENESLVSRYDELSLC